MDRKAHIFFDSALHKYWFLILILLRNAVLPTPLFATHASPKLTLHENTAQALRFTISISTPTFSQQQLGDRLYDLIQLNGFVLQHRLGVPAIPTLSYTLILPPEGNFQLRFATTPGLRFSGKKLLPSLQAEVDRAADSVRYSLVEIKEVVVDLPPVRLVETGIWRGFRLGRLEIIPLHIRGEELQFFSEIEVVIEFDSSWSIAPQQSSPLTNIERAVLHSALNFAVAQNWRARPAVPAKQAPRPFGFFDGALKIAIKVDGWYSISYRLLDSLGFHPATLKPSTFQIWNRGQEIPIRLLDDGDDQFEIGEAVEFFGERLAGDSTYYHDYAEENIYWLTFAGTENKRISTRQVVSTMEPLPARANYFWQWRHFEEDNIYYHGDNETQIFSSLTAPGETWIWQKLIGGEFFLDNLAIPSPAPAGAPSCSLRARVRGTTVDRITPSHHLRFLINNNVIGEVFFDDTEEVIFRAAFPSQWLREGKNTFQLLSVNDTGAQINQIYFDWVEIGYWRQYLADGNVLDFREPENASGGWSLYQISNLASAQVLLFDHRHHQILEGFALTQTAPGQFQIAFVDSATSGRDYFVLTPAARRTPAKIWADSPSDWRAASNAADYILITHADFRAAAQRLAQHRQQYGNLRVAVVEVEDIYDEFNFGIPHPEAIRQFLHQAFLNWQRPAPTFVCLLGDASLDPTFKAIGSYKPNFILSYGNPASDNRLVCFDGPLDFLPEIFVGRLPVETPVQAEAVVDKIIFYETTPVAEWNKTFIFLNGGADRYEQEIFRTQSEALINRYVLSPPVSGRVVRIYKTTPGHIVGELRSEILSAIDAGAFMLTFSGHAGSQTWELMVVNADIAALRNRDLYPLIASMTCHTARFANSDQSSFGEEFLRPPDKGAIAFWGTSGFGFVFQDGILLDSMYSYLSRDTLRYAGVVTTLAKIGLWKALGNAPININTIDQYTLLGDPALRLALPTAPDLSITPANIKFQPPSPTEDDPAVQVTVKVRNLGLATTDSATVEITATSVESGGTQILQEAQIGPIGWADSVVAYWLSRGHRGEYRVRAEVDRSQEIAEINEANNLAERTIYFAPSTVTLAAPIHFGLLKDNRPIFRVYNPATPGRGARTHFFEIDTTADFSSPAKLISPGMTEDRLRTNWQVPSPLLNHLYFWRSRMVDNELTSAWQVASFWIDTQASVAGFRQTGVQFSNGLFDKTILLTASEGMGGVTLAPGQTQGTYQSVEIGPAKMWHVLKWEGGASSQWSVARGQGQSPYGLQLAVLGRSAGSNDWQVLQDSLITHEISLTDIKAQHFSFLRIVAKFRDDDGIDPPVLSGWTVGFDPTSDFATGPQVVSVSSDSVLEGESVRLVAEVFHFSNSPTAGAEKVQITFSQFDPRAERGKRLLATYSTTLAPESSQNFVLDWNSAGSRGEVTFFVDVDPDNQYVEPVEFNNTTTRSVFVRADKTAPRVEVTFDGHTVITGDYVSPRPTILCKILDDSLLPIVDTSRVQVYLDEERVAYTGAEKRLQLVSFSSGPVRAEVTFRPQLAEGKHVIEFFVRDATNNPAYHRAEVQVDTEFRLREVMNYPNPFRNETDFTYYLTQPAEEVTIKIFTLSGRLIATIDHAPTTAGFNRAHWNGRDADGEVLANGVYLYKLTAKLGERRLEEIQKCVVMR